MTNKIITAELIKSKGACESQIELFNQLFPAGIIPTKELCIKHANDFDWNWAAKYLLSEDAQNIYDESSLAPARKIYDETIVPALKIYNESIANARKIYDESVAYTGEIYNELRAIAWFNCWEKENN